MYLRSITHVHDRQHQNRKTNAGIPSMGAGHFHGNEARSKLCAILQPIKGEVCLTGRSYNGLYIVYLTMFPSRSHFQDPVLIANPE